MATKNIVPRATNEGSIGTITKRWGNGYFSELNVSGDSVGKTQSAGDNSTKLATTAYVDNAVSGLVDSAPETLDTLKELSDALGDDPNFATTMATELGKKVDKTSADYIKSASVSGKTLTLTKGNDTTVTFTEADTQYTNGNGLNLSNGTFSVKPSTNVTVDGNGVSVPGSGTVTNGNIGLVSGGTLFTEGRVSSDGNYTHASYTVAQNLTVLDAQVKTNTDNIATKAPSVSPALTGNPTAPTQVSTDDSTKIATTEFVHDNTDDKAKADASNVGANATTDNSEDWGDAIGGGAVASANKKLITGGTAYTELRPRNGVWVKNSQTTAANLEKLELGIENAYFLLSHQYEQLKQYVNGNYYNYQTDSTSAYTKSVPSGAMPYAGLEKVGGRTVAWNQLVQNGNFADSTGWNVTTTGATISVADNIATITYNGGTLQDYHPALKSSDITCYKNNKYLISFDIKFSKQGQANFASPIANYQSFVVEANTWHKERSIKEKTTNTSTGYFYIGDSKAPDNFDVGDTIQYKNIMIIDLTLLFGAGNEPSTVEEFEAMFPADYYEYNAGTLLSAGVTEVESVGKNLLNPNDINRYQNMKKVGDVFENTGADSRTIAYWTIQLYIGDTYVYGQNIDSAGNATFTTTDDINIVSIGHGGAQADEKVFFNLTLDKGKTYTVSIKQTGNAPNVVGGFSFTDVQVEESANETAYSPYFNETYPIPAVVQALEGYGWSAGTAYNYIDFEKKVFVKKVGKIEFNGNQNIAVVNVAPLSNSVAWTYAQTTNRQKYYGVDRQCNVVASERFIEKPYDYLMSNNGDFICTMNPNYYSFTIRCTDTSLTTSTAINNYLSNNPITVYYELETPIEVDISEYLMDDNLINVESGGTLTFENQHGDDYRLPVPSEETYMIDLQSAIGG